MMTHNTKMAVELALLLVLSKLWGASYSFIKIGVETVPPNSLIAGANHDRRGDPGSGDPMARPPSAARSADRGRFMFQACLNSVVPFTLIAWAQQTTDAGTATVLNSTSPIFAFLLTVLITRHERLRGSSPDCICMIVGVEALRGLGYEVLAQIAIVAATVCYAGAAIFGKSFKGLDPMMPAAESLIFGAVIWFQ